MNVDILLEQHEVWPWFQSEYGYFRGYIYNDENILLQDEIALAFLKSQFAGDKGDLQKSLNGCFSAIFWEKGFCFAISDAIGSFPLFYCKSADKLFLADDARILAQKNNIALTEDTLHFELFSICPDDKTLFPGVNQLLAGEGICAREQDLVSFTHGYLAQQKVGKQQDIQKVWDSVIDRLVQGNLGKQWLIPLSGGWDSRLLLASLWDRGIRNIVTYTYGRRDSFEVKAAQEVAAKLGLDWHFIEYNEDCLSEFWSLEFQQFLIRQSRGSISVQEQELFALLVLKHKGILQTNSIALPGYCGDLLAGSYTLPTIREDDVFDRRIAEQWILAKHMSWIDSKSYHQIAFNMLSDELFHSTFKTMGEWSSHYEKWFTQQKVSKYILSGLRSFEHVGLEWRMPYWDRAWMDYWYNVPLENRWNRVSFKRWANLRYFTPLGIAIKDDHEVSFIFNSFKERFRSSAPWLFTTFKKINFWRKSMDINNSGSIKEKLNSLLEQQRIVVKIHELNPMLAQWTLSELIKRVDQEKH